MKDDRSSIMQSANIIKKLLLKQAGDLEQRLSSIMSEEMTLYQTQYGADRYDISFFQDEIQNLNLISKSQTLKKLGEVKRSLEKLRVGSYGICDRCRQEIDQERLRILISASLCRECK